MGTHLKAVIEFCETNFTNGKLIHIIFKFPSFEITENMYREMALDVVAEKVRIGVDSGRYGHPLMPDLSYDELLESQIAKNENRSSKIQDGQFTFIEKILPRQMTKDDNMATIEVSRKILSELCSTRIKDKFMNIEHLHTYCAAYGDMVSTTMIEKSKFVASMLMLKEEIPSSYRQINISLQDYPNKELVNEIKNMQLNPDIGVIKHIHDIDSKFTEKHFPQEHRHISENETKKIRPKTY